jgi:hypothetical protein
MPFPIATGVEIIPGYQLLQKLGTGGYAEVWKATAPGGMTKAIKIVYGDIDGPRAEQELKALERIKEVRHPFLLSLERFEVVENRLIIVAELADRSLQERYEQCRASGQVGIPRDELLGHLRDAAEALDYMSETYGLQHLDIKPQNLLLVGGRIKVADFGLVKDLVGTSVTATGGVTPLYATPEAFDGRVSRYSDQYSLAIVYQEMLTGVRPFPGTTTLQLAAQHATCRPLLEPLPPHDRPVIARALSKVPEQRYPTCREMAEHLLRNRDLAVPPPPIHPPIGPAAAREPEARSATPVLRTGVVHLTSIAQQPLDPETEGRSALSRATEVDQGPPPVVPLVPPCHPAGEDIRLTQGRRWRATPQVNGKAGLRPTLILGLGGVACTTLRRLKQRLQHRFGNLAAVPVLRFLFLDTDRAGVRRARQAGTGAALEVEETLLTPLHPPDHYRARSKALRRWLDRRWLFGVPRSQLTEGLRPLGQLALVDNAADILSRLREALSQITSQAAQAAATNATGLELRTQVPRIFVVASIAGGTGGGMLIGMGYALRQILAELRLPSDGLCGFLVHATGPKPADRDMARINAYATLRELNHCSRPDATYPGNPDHELMGFGPGEAPFQECYLLHLGDQLTAAETDASTDALAAYLEFDTATAGGTVLDHCRAGSSSAEFIQNGNPTIRTFGLSQISFPRHRLAELAATLLCRQVVARWPGKVDDACQRDDLERAAHCQVAAAGLEVEALVPRLLETAEAALGEDADGYFLKRLADCRPDGDTPQAQVLARLDYLLGAGPDAGAGAEKRRNPFETATQLRSKEAAAQLGHLTLEWLIQLVEDPRKRLAAADCAVAWLMRHLLDAADGVAAQLTQLRTYRVVLRQRLAAGDRVVKDSGLRWLGNLCRQGNAGTTERRFVEYCWLRLGEVALENAAAVFRSVHAEVSQFSQDLVLCRQKVSQFGAQFKPPAALGPTGASDETPVPKLTEVLPNRSTNLTQAATGVFGSQWSELARRLDETLQQEVLNPQGGLWGLLLGDRAHALGTSCRSQVSLVFWQLDSTGCDAPTYVQKELRGRAGDMIHAALKDLDAAQLFLEMQGGPDHARQALSATVQAAFPRLASAGSRPLLVLAVPPGPAGTTLRDLVAEDVPNVPLTVVESEGDVLMCSEAAYVSLRQTAAALVGKEAAHAEMAGRVMTRVDVDWSDFPLESH